MIGLDVVVQALLSGLFMGSVYALIAIGFTLVFGVTDIVNFAHGHLVMAAMFVTYVLFKSAHVDPYLSLLIVLPAFFGVGALLYWLVIQRIVEAPHSAHMMVTLGLLLVFENLANLFFGGDLRGITTTYTTSSYIVGPWRCRWRAWAPPWSACWRWVRSACSWAAPRSARPFAPRPTTARAPRWSASTCPACI
jgi:branched-chain amino acid transport system permease protein